MDVSRPCLAFLSFWGLLEKLFGLFFLGFLRVWIIISRVLSFVFSRVLGLFFLEFWKVNPSQEFTFSVGVEVHFLVFFFFSNDFGGFLEGSILLGVSRLST